MFLNKMWVKGKVSSGREREAAISFQTKMKRGVDQKASADKSLAPGGQRIAQKGNNKLGYIGGK